MLLPLRVRSRTLMAYLLSCWRFCFGVLSTLLQIIYGRAQRYLLRGLRSVLVMLGVPLPIIHPFEV